MSLIKGYTPEGLPIFSNPDKDLCYERPDEDGVAVFGCHPSRFLIIGAANCGKTNQVKTIITFKKRSYDRVIVIHPVALGKEYEIFNRPSVWGFDFQDFSPETMPKVEELFTTSGEDAPATCLVIDDVDLSRHIPDDYFSWVSSHCNTTIIASYQSFFRVPKFFRDNSTHILIFPSRDADTTALISRRMGLSPERLKKIEELFDLREGDKNFLIFTFDETKTPRIRCNWVKTLKD